LAKWQITMRARLKDVLDSVEVSEFIDTKDSLDAVEVARQMAEKRKWILWSIKEVE